MKRAIIGLVALALVATLTQAVSAKGPGSSLTCPTFNASNFPSPTTNGGSEDVQLDSVP